MAEIDANRYSVQIAGGLRVEATYYRGDQTFVGGDHVFLEYIQRSALWMIASHAFGSAGSSPVSWFQFDVLGFDRGHLAP